MYCDTSRDTPLAASVRFTCAHAAGAGRAPPTHQRRRHAARSCKHEHTRAAGAGAAAPPRHPRRDSTCHPGCLHPLAGADAGAGAAAAACRTSCRRAMKRSSCDTMLAPASRFRALASAGVMPSQEPLLRAAARGGERRGGRGRGRT